MGSNKGSPVRNKRKRLVKTSIAGCTIGRDDSSRPANTAFGISVESVVDRNRLKLTVTQRANRPSIIPDGHARLREHYSESDAATATAVARLCRDSARI